MNDKIRELLAQITALEDEVEEALREQQEHVLYQIKDGKIRFEKSIEEAHKEIKQGLLRWFLDSRPRNVLSAPFIYGMILPFAFFDLCLSCYQGICFPLYKIGRVNRSAYIVIDRHNLKHLNSLERLNCVYCGYANGLLGYAREIASRTEQYWCPIKHAKKILGRHPRYHNFIDFGDTENLHERRKQLRKLLADETNGDKN